MTVNFPSEFVQNERASRRHPLRHEKIITANIDYIKDKTVLDLACSNGRWTWAAMNAAPSM